jgi:integrase
MVLYLVLDRLKVDLNSRLNDHRFLELGEVEELARSARLPVTLLSRSEQEMDKAPSKRSGLEKVRLAASAQSRDEVSPSTAALRLLYIRKYLIWRADAHLLKLSHSRDRAGFSRLEATARVVLEAIKERIPPDSKGSISDRQGMSDSDLARLLEVVKPDSPENPWQNAHARVRNALIVLWLLKLGPLRRGELLGVKVRDINFQAKEPNNATVNRTRALLRAILRRAERDCERSPSAIAAPQCARPFEMTGGCAPIGISANFSSVPATRLCSTGSSAPMSSASTTEPSEVNTALL